MKKIEHAAELEFEEGSPFCLALGGIHCAKVICPNITPIDEVYCKYDFFKAIEVELIKICTGEFFRACAKFGDIVGPICPFDPVRLADKYQLVAQIEELQVKVEELAAKI